MENAITHNAGNGKVCEEIGKNGKKGGAPSKKMKKFPSIINYLQKHEQDVHDLFVDLNVQNSLIPRRGAPGITFLIPDAKYVAEIKKQIDSDEPEIAGHMIFSLIIPDYIQSVEDWKRDEIGNLLSRKIEVTEIKGEKVHIKDGTLVLDNKFVPFDRMGTAKRGNMAVWKLTGKVNYKDAPEITKIVPFRKKGVKTGSEDLGIEKEITEFRKDIIYNTRNIQQSQMLDFICAAIEFAKKSESTIYDKLKVIAYPNYIVVFMLMFGLRGASNLFANTDIINFIREYKKKYLKKHCNSTIFNEYITDANKMGNRSDFADFKYAKRDLLLQKLNSSTFKEIEKNYELTDKSNKMGFPLEVSAIFQTTKNLHLIIDLACYTFGSYCENCKYINSPRKNLADIQTLFDKNENISVDRLKNMISPFDDTKAVESFIKSGCFFRFPGDMEITEGGDDDDSSEEEKYNNKPGAIKLEIEDETKVD